VVAVVGIIAAAARHFIDAEIGMRSP